MNGKSGWKRVVWGALCLVVIGAVVAPFFLPPGLGDWFVSNVPSVATSPTSITFSPDGKQLAAGSFDGAVRVWEVATGQLHQTLAVPGLHVTGVAFSPTGEWLASGSEDGTV